jgi:hypothetical protein
VQTRRELLERIQELEAENEDLQSRLDEISDIVTGNDEAEEQSEEEGRWPAYPVAYIYLILANVGSLPKLEPRLRARSRYPLER